MKFLYDTVLGRFILNLMLNTGILKLAEKWVKSGCSKGMIKRFIKKNNIDMTEYEGQEYKSYADFFMRKKEIKDIDLDKNVLISPCDGLLSIYDIADDSVFTVKGIPYRINELIPKKETADLFKNGQCLIFRLEAKDYHHFCYIDDGIETGIELIPGKVHSVQPIALEKYPVFRQNKRYCHLLKTEHLGDVMQVEVAAVLVGGAAYEVTNGPIKKGQEEGHFELCGSTIIIMITEECKKNISYNSEILQTINSGIEQPVKYGKGIGVIVD